MKSLGLFMETNLQFQMELEVGNDFVMRSWEFEMLWGSERNLGPSCKTIFMCVCDHCIMISPFSELHEGFQNGCRPYTSFRLFHSPGFVLDGSWRRWQRITPVDPGIGTVWICLTQSPDMGCQAGYWWSGPVGFFFFYPCFFLWSAMSYGCNPGK